MTVFTGTVISRLATIALDDLPLSVSYAVESAHIYSPDPSVQEMIEGGARSVGHLLPYPDKLFHVNGAQVGSSTTTIYDELVLVQSGVLLTSYSLSMGYVIAGQTILLGVFNGAGESNAITSITFSDPSVLSVDGISTSTTFGPYQEIEITLTILSSAPTDFSCTVTISTDKLGDTSFTISGISSISFCYLPQSFDETIAYKTELLAACNGEEQRICLRQYPRHLYDTDYTLPTGYGGSSFRALLTHAYPSSLSIPSWGMLEKLDYIPAVDDETITFDTSNGAYAAGIALVIWQSNLITELISITSIADGVITLDSPISVEFTEEVYLAPIDNCFIKQQPGYSNDAIGNVFASLTLQGQTTFDTDEASFDTTYNDKPVILDNNIFESKTEDRSISGGTYVLDAGVGKASITTNWDESKKIYTRGFHLTTPALCWAFRQYLAYFKGRLKTAYFPTLDHDFIMTRDLAIEDVVIYCEMNYFSRYYDPDTQTIFSHVFITDGTNNYFREIIATEEVSDDEQSITLDSTLGVVYTTGELKICLMPLCRQVKDSIKLEWDRSGEAYAIVEYTGVKE